MPKTVLTLILVLCFASPCPAESAGEKGATIAVVLSSSDGPFAETFEGFRTGLSRLREEVDYLVYPLPASASERVDLMGRIADRSPDLLFVLGSAALESAAEMKKEIPILAGMILREEDFGLYPGSTGVYLEFPPETHFTWLRTILPEAETVGVIYNRKQNRHHVAAADRAAEAAGLKLVARTVDDARELPFALKDLSRRVDVLWGISDEVVLTPQTARHILLFSFRQRIPFIGLSSAWAKAGALYALDRDYRDMGRQCAEMALGLLEGTEVGKIPPRPPREVVYALNLKTARQMRIALPAPVISNASEVF